MQINTTSAAFLAVHQQAAEELKGDDLCGTGEEGLRDRLGARGGYGCA
jgi:hydroxymethylglutaryl-CoA reductase